MTSAVTNRRTASVETRSILGLVSTWVFALLPANLIPAIIGRLVAMPLARLIGRAPMLLILLISILLAKIGLMITTSPVVFTLSNFVWGFAFGAMLPVIFGLAAQMRRNGSASVLVNGVYIFGVALGPLVSSQIYAATNAFVLCVSMTAIAIVGAIPIVLIARMSQQQVQEEA